MSARMKKRRTSEGEIEIVIHDRGTSKFRVSRKKAEALLLLLDELRVKGKLPLSRVDKETVPADDVFRALDEKYGRAGAALRGARLKEGLSQVALAEKLKIRQADLSKMEHGKRSIGKKMAKKLAQVLKVDYRVFL